MSFLSRVFKGKDGSPNSKKRSGAAQDVNILPMIPRFASTWESNEVVIEEVEELLHLCTIEMKSRAEALGTPFLLLPFRPEVDVTSAKAFVADFFKANKRGAPDYRGESLKQELRLTDSEILCSVVKWLWSRIPNGVVSWAVYESFKVGERESDMAINSFDTFIPLAVESQSRKNIIYDFFDLLASIAAHGKANGMGGRKLSRMAGWWAFEQVDTGKGFDGGYKAWADAANASSHLFFAFLRSRAPEAINGISGISNLPRSLQALVAQTEYPPAKPSLMQSSTPKVLMIVDSVSPTPFALLRRARLFEYRASDRALNRFAEYSDPVDALTEECKRVLMAIAAINQSKKGALSASRLPSNTSIASSDDQWSRFQDEGFAFRPVDSANQSPQPRSPLSKRDSPPFHSANMQARAQSRLALGGRPQTPSWADFMQAGFNNDNKPAFLLHPEKSLPPIVEQSLADEDADDLKPGELASIFRFELDDSFWWVWMMSLAGEETSSRKAAFGRCTLVETCISGGRWLLLEEQVKGASPTPAGDAYVAEKKSRSFFSRKNRSAKKKGQSKESKKPSKHGTTEAPTTPVKGEVTPDQKAKISAVAAALASRNTGSPTIAMRRGRFDDNASTKTSSILTVGFTREASPAMKWAVAYDKDAVRKQFLGDNYSSLSDSALTPVSIPEEKENEDPSARATPEPSPRKPVDRNKELPSPKPEKPAPRTEWQRSESSNSSPRPDFVRSDTGLSARSGSGSPSPPPPRSPKITVEDMDSPAAERSPRVLFDEDDANISELPAELPPALARSASINRGRAQRPYAYQHKQVHPALRREPTLVERIPSKRTPNHADRENIPYEGPNKLVKEKHAGAGGGLKRMFGKKRDDPRRQSQDLSKSSSQQTPDSSPAAPRVLAQRSPAPGMDGLRSNPASNRRDVGAAGSPRPVPGRQASKGTPSKASTTKTAERLTPPNSSSPLQRSTQERWAPASRDSAETDIMSPMSPTFPDRGVGGNANLKPSLREQSHFTRSQQALVTTNDAISEEGSDGGEVTPQVSHGDRWAQIRKNAAERAAAAKAGEGEKSKAGTTEDGETSGEETIEERVARIKARVAHLTGNATAVH